MGLMMIFRPLGESTCLKAKTSTLFRSSATGEYDFFKSDFSWGDRIRRLYHPEGKKPRNFYTNQWFSAANVAKSRFWRPWFSEGRIVQSAFSTGGKFLANSSAQFMTNIFYYKEVNCSQSQVMQVLTEAEKLLPAGNWSQYLDDNLRILLHFSKSVESCKVHSSTKIIFLAQQW